MLYLICTMLMLAAHGAYAMCWTLAADKYGIEPGLLKAIAQVESGMNARAHHVNTNGSYDIGLMQINSLHLPALKRQGITENALVENPCLSVMTGASILSGMIGRYGYNWEAVGAYNAGTAETRKALRLRYARSVWRYYVKNME